MYTEETYKYKLNGITYVGGNVPKDVEILETMTILIAEEGYTLIRKNSGEDVGNSIWLRDGDKSRNYTEIEVITDGD